MKKFALAAVAAVTASFASANAALIDFAAYADTFGERGLQPDEILTIDGVALSAFGFADNFGAPAFAYLDENVAGLGVCQVLDADDQCTPSNDDNVTEGETLIITFLNGEVNFTDLIFRQADHSLVDGGSVTISTVNVFGEFFTLTDTFANFIVAAQTGAEIFQGVVSIQFDFVDTQFYISAIETPLPAALPLLISGVAGLGFASRRRKSV